MDNTNTVTITLEKYEELKNEISDLKSDVGSVQDDLHNYEESFKIDTPIVCEMRNHFGNNFLKIHTKSELIISLNKHIEILNKQNKELRTIKEYTLKDYLKSLIGKNK